MTQLIDKITIQESNLADATKREYHYRLGQFYAFGPIKSDDELIDYSTEKLQGILVNYARQLIKQVNASTLSD